MLRRLKRRLKTEYKAWESEQATPASGRLKKERVRKEVTGHPEMGVGCEI